MTIWGLILSPRLSLALKKATFHFIFPSHFRSEKIFSYIVVKDQVPGFIQQRDKIVVRYAHTIYPCPFVASSDSDIITPYSFCMYLLGQFIEGVFKEAPSL